MWNFPQKWFYFFIRRMRHFSLPLEMWKIFQILLDEKLWNKIRDLISNTFDFRHEFNFAPIFLPSWNFSDWILIFISWFMIYAFFSLLSCYPLCLCANKNFNIKLIRNLLLTTFPLFVLVSTFNQFLCLLLKLYNFF